MAEHVYEILIRYDDLPDGSQNGQAPIAQNTAAQEKKSSTGNTASAVALASSVIVPTINAALTMQTNEIRTITGSDQLARRQEIVNSTVDGAVTLAQSAIGGATIAASFGKALGISTGAGVAMGIVSSLLGKVMDIAVKTQDIQNRMQAESTQIAVTRARGGITWDMSRGRNR